MIVLFGRMLLSWITLLPPTESIADGCTIPPDDPRTPFNETSLFDPTKGYSDYSAWAQLVGLLAAKFPRLVALQVDDMSHDIQPPSGIFQPPLIAGKDKVAEQTRIVPYLCFLIPIFTEMSSHLRSQAPWVSLVSTMYYSEGASSYADFVWRLWPGIYCVVGS